MLYTILGCTKRAGQNQHFWRSHFGCFILPAKLVDQWPALCVKYASDFLNGVRGKQIKQPLTFSLSGAGFLSWFYRYKDRAIYFAAITGKCARRISLLPVCLN